MAIDRIRHNKPVSKRSFLDELEPIPYEITQEEIKKMDPRMRAILFGIEEVEEDADEDVQELLDRIDEQQYEEIDIPDPEKQATSEAVEQTEEEIEDPVEVAAKQDIMDIIDLPEQPGPHITLVVRSHENLPALDDFYKNILAYSQYDFEGVHWLALRFGKDQAEELREINNILSNEDVQYMYNGKRVPFGKSLWSPLMNVFTAGNTINQ